MPRREAPKPDPGPIELAVLAELANPGRTGAENRLAARAIRVSYFRQAADAVHANAQHIFIHKGFRIHMLEPPVEIEGGVRCRVQAWKVQGNVELPTDDGVHVCMNPPTKVPDGNYHLVPLVPSSSPGDPPVEMDNFAEDPVQAFRDWLVESVQVAARHQGWAG